MEHCLSDELLKPIESILTPSSCRSLISRIDINASNLGQSAAKLDTDTQSILNDKIFVKANAITNLDGIVGREKSLIALHKTYKNIDKAE